MKHQKITILGLGNVGKAIALALLQERNTCYTINLIDIEVEGKLKGTIIDLTNAAEVSGLHRFVISCSGTLQASEYIFHCVGVGVAYGGSRLEIVEDNRKITKDILNGVAWEHNPVIIVVTNPLDAMTYYTQLYTKQPRERVIGTGTLLDTARLKHWMISTYNTDEVACLVVGEHGDSMVIVPEKTSVKGTCLSDEEYVALINKTKETAHLIKTTQGATFFGVAQCAVRIMRAVENDEKISIPVSTCLSEAEAEQLGVRSIAMSRVCEVGRAGAVAKQMGYHRKTLEEIMKSAQIIDGAIHGK